MEQRHLRRLLDVHERDRRLFAYEIHDGFVQTATGALMNLETGAGKVAHSGDDECLEVIETATGLLRRSIASARRMMNGMRPPILDDAGIIAGIEHLVWEVRDAGGPDVAVLHVVQFDRLAPPLESAVFRIVQESVTNACRHGRATNIEVRLTQDKNTLHVEVEDNGVGFDTTTAKGGGFGIEGIYERARLLGGTASIESRPGQGTRVTAELPIIEAAAAGD